MSQKFYYLRSTLNKEVLEVIKNLEITGDNYEVTSKLLQERYENKGLLFHNHIKAIVEYPNVQYESFKELRALYDTFKRHLRAL
ncbi:hypothetical protein NQ314_014108 [Rhamnusium bicolor]|uniref:Uncharacterized protein n=1 Tax=Rhamnusium bicolor TaxID=1586634 RepID=A0AAV8X2U7_9CUCU|nr:hypothetical protein NQ314_014108 [Rhamnusium bicolor]